MATPTPEQYIRGHQAAVAQVRSRIETYASLVWAGQGDYRDADVDRMVARIVPRVLAGQRTIAGLTDAYLAALGGTRAGVDAGLVTGAAVRNGAAPEDVYRRPAKTIYRKLSEGMPFGEAVAAGGARLLSIVGTDMQLGMRAQERRSLESGGWKSYKRVLTGSESCALCAIASTQRYNTADLMPIHPGCDCTVEPLNTPSDPGQIIDNDLLETIHGTIGDQLGLGDRSARDLGLNKTGAKGNDLKDYTELIVTREHGEYGPTLTWRSDNFTGPGDIT